MNTLFNWCAGSWQLSVCGAFTEFIYKKSSSNNMISPFLVACAHSQVMQEIMTINRLMINLSFIYHYYNERILLNIIPKRKDCKYFKIPRRPPFNISYFLVFCTTTRTTRNSSYIILYVSKLTTRTQELITHTLLLSLHFTYFQSNI